LSKLLHSQTPKSMPAKYERLIGNMKRSSTAGKASLFVHPIRRNYLEETNDIR